MNAVISKVLENTRFDTKTFSAKQVGCYKMIYDNGEWKGKWDARNTTFKEEGVTSAEKEVLSAFAEWVNSEFSGGAGIKKYLNEHSEHMGKDGRMRVSIKVDDISYIVVQYSSINAMGEYPIKVYLYRAAV